MKDANQPLFRCVAALLRQGQTIHDLSRLLTAAALVVIGASAGFEAVRSLLIGSAAVAVAGLVEMYFAVRVGFDAALFDGLSQVPDLAGMDAALTDLDLLAGAKAARPAAARVEGAKRLFRFQILALAVQLSSMFVAAAVGVLWR